MKFKDKSKILLFALPILFLSLHYFGYMTESLDGIPVITSPELDPLQIENLRLEKELLPDYFHPFQMLERHYAEKASGEIVVIEKGRLIRYDEMNIVMGDPTDYFADDRPDNMLIRGLAVDDYPNGIFFLLQYLIILAFVFLATKKILNSYI